MTLGAFEPSWAEVKSYFDQALALEPPLQQAWLADLDTTQPGIAQAVRGLLAQHDALTTFGRVDPPLFADAQDLVQAMRAALLRPTSADSAPDLGGHSGAALRLPPGSAIGPYRLIREIGQGGMSSVWLAERSDGQLKRQVALKLPFCDQRLLVARFLRERDILSGLTHPQIARLYDAGISKSGQPYLAMEYIEGAALLHDCDRLRLTIHQRLRVFLQVLEAVQYAHAQLVIHRDLKPSNILVTPQGRVVLLDFGIGKLLIDGVADATLMTQIAGRALTPDYAAPEQVAGQALSTASDIYSLGVILYELLAGARPYRPRRASQAALEESILIDELRRPSHSIGTEAAESRGVSSRALARLLAGDLDTIVLKALKKSPLERYASVTAFAQDITNYLQNLPVGARPDSHWYRVGRFVSRHRMPVVAASVTLIAVLSGAALAVWQARAAATQRDRAVALASRNEAISDFLQAVLTDTADPGKSITLRELLSSAERLANNTRNSPENRAGVFGMLASQYLAFGEIERAKQLTHQSLGLLTHSSDRALQSELRCYDAYLDSQLGHTKAAVARITAELTHLDSDPMTASDCLADLAALCSSACEPGDALRYAEAGLARVREISPATDITLTREAKLLNEAAYGHSLQGENQQADRYFEQALRIYASLDMQDGDDAQEVKNDWALVAEDEGNPRRAVQLYEELSLDETASISAGNKGRTLQSLGRFEAARAAFEIACPVGNEPGDDISVRLNCLLGRASLEIDTQALRAASNDVQLAGSLVEANLPADDRYAFWLTVVRGQLELAHGRFMQAHSEFSHALAAKSPRMLMHARLGLAETELALGNPSKAVELARIALQAARARQGAFAYSNRTGLASLVLGRALLQLGEGRDAQSALETAVMHLSKTVDADHPALAQARQLQR